MSGNCLDIKSSRDETQVTAVKMQMAYDQLTDYGTLVTGTGTWILQAASSTLFGETETADGEPVVLSEAEKYQKGIVSRLETLEDTCAKTCVQRDQAQFEMRLCKEEIENLRSQLFNSDAENMLMKKEGEVYFFIICFGFF